VGVVLPDWAATMLDLIGVSWPNVDEDDYLHTANSLRDFAHDLDDNTGAANQHMQRLLASGRGQSMQALGAHWGKVKDKHLKDLATAATVIAGALDLAAGAITAQKGEAITQLGYLADETGIALALIPETGGLSALLDAGAIEATQQVVKQLFQAVAKDAVSYIVSALAEPAVAALDGMAVDLAIQLAADGMGVQDGVNLNEVKQAGKDGFHQGVGSAKSALHLDSVGSGGGGGGGGGSDDVLIDHAEHERASTHLNVVGASMHGKTRGHIFKARGHLGRTRGRGVIAEAIEPVADKAVNALEKAATELGDHIKDRLPKAVQQISKDFRNTDQDIKDGFHKLDRHHGKDGDFHLASKGPGREPAYTRPDSLRDAKSAPRRHGIPLNGKTCKGDPIDVATGEMTLPQTDLSLPGVLPLVLRRTHLSEYRYGQWFGRSWASTLDERIELDSLGTGAIWAREDGSLLVYPRLPQPGGEPILPLEGPRLPLAHGGADNAETVYRVSDPRTGLTRSFTGSPYNESTAYWLTEITDRNNNRITIDRRSDGTPTTVIHHGGYTVQLTASDARIRTLALRTPDGPVTVMSYGYDTIGNLNAVTNASGLPLRFTYDPDGRITSWTDRNNSTFTYIYDPDGRIGRTIGPDGFLSCTFAYETHPETGQRITRYTNSTGATTAYHLNDRLQVVAETDPLGNITRQSWDIHDRLLTRTDALGHTTELTWDEAGNLTAVRLPDGTVTTARYNQLNLPVDITDSQGAVWQQIFDELGNCTSTRSPDGAVTRFTYHRNGAVASVTDALGSTTRIRAHTAGLPLEITDARSATTHVERDYQGRPTSITNATGAVDRFEWGVEDQLLAEGAPDDATADYLHRYFEPTARAIDGLEKALAGLGLLDDALALDLRKPQDYFHRVWSTAFRAAHLAAARTEEEDEYSDTCTAEDTDPEQDVA
jgi:YD repeat-containing protein